MAGQGNGTLALTNMNCLLIHFVRNFAQPISQSTGSIAPQCYLRLRLFLAAAPPLSPPCSDRSWTRRRWCRCGCCHGWWRGCRCRDVERMPSLASISRLEEAAKGVTMILGRLLRGTDPLDGPDSSEYRWRWTTGARKTELRCSSLLLLSAGVSAAFSFFSRVAVAPATSVPTSVRARSLARLIVVCFLPRWLRARALNKNTCGNFLIRYVALMKKWML